MAKMITLTTLDLHRLDMACVPVWSAFQDTYLVGSSQRGVLYRDIDVRTILDDAEFDRLFGGEGGQRQWELICTSIGMMLAQQTGLPIDYQIQRQTEANAKHAGPRNPIGTKRNYAGLGDATPW